jgi:transposase-like protein
MIDRTKFISREEFERSSQSTRISLIKQLIPLGLMAAAEELQKEVDALVADRDASRFGSNPGSIVLGSQRVAINVPRVRQKSGEIPLKSYELLHQEDDRETLYRSILHGVSCGNYSRTIPQHRGAISKSRSTTSRHFVTASQSRLKEFQSRDLSGLDIVALFMDGTAFAGDQMVIALGIELSGKKVALGFVQSATENARVIGQFLQSMIERGLGVDQGLLAVVDGSKGLISGVRQSIGKKVLVQRCQWHKRENVVSYLPKGEQEAMRRRLQHAYERPTYDEAQSLLAGIQRELDTENQSAAASLKEGLTETLTLHRLGLFAKLGLSFKTTNCLESVNAMAEEVCGKVDYWKNSSQKQRWLASALMDIEPRLRRVQGFEHLPSLRRGLKKELGM